MKKLFVKFLKTIRIIKASLKQKESVEETTIFNFPEVSTEDWIKIVESFNANNVAGPDHISSKIMKTVANITDSRLAHIINKDLKENRLHKMNTMLVRNI